jgi:hypothetical protein
MPFATADVEVERLGVDRDHNNAFRVWDGARPSHVAERGALARDEECRRAHAARFGVWLALALAWIPFRRRR